MPETADRHAGITSDHAGNQNPTEGFVRRSKGRELGSGIAGERRRRCGGCGWRGRRRTGRGVTKAWARAGAA